MKTKKVVTGFLKDSGKILILRRSDKVGSYQGRWAGVSGYVEEGNSPCDQVYIEILEETGLKGDDLILLKEGKPLKIPDPSLDVIWVVYPFLFGVPNPKKIKIDWEHTEFRWIKPEELEGFETVPSLMETLNTLI